MFIDKINITLRLGCLIRGFFKPDVFKKCFERLLLSCGVTLTMFAWYFAPTAAGATANATANRRPMESSASRNRHSVDRIRT